MKKMLTIAVSVLFVASFALMSFSTVQDEKKGDDQKTAIPDNVKSILEKSCYPCHTSPGNKMAMMKVNMEKWHEYDAEKQEKKAGKMCSMVSKGSMPPKNFRTNNPDKVPTDKEIQTICDWASSLKKDK